MLDDSPFFIVGSVLSGTTLLRNILRQHPNLICPEETHVFRWGKPFGTEEFNDLYNHADTLKLHRSMDNVSDEQFAEVLDQSMDRKSFMLNYMQAFNTVQNNKLQNQESLRWFDKSPQNVYGMVLIKAYFPEAKFIHIVRNPLNVIASIKRGHPDLSGNIIGSINYWKEAILIINTLKKVWADDIHEFKYEDLCNNPQTELNKLMAFVNDEQVSLDSVIDNIRAPDNNYQSILTASEIQLINDELYTLMSQYEYS